MDNLPRNNFLTIQEAAKFLGVSPKTLRRWDKEGIFSPQRTAGNQRRYLLSDIEKFKNFPRTPKKPEEKPKRGPKTYPHLPWFYQILLLTVFLIGLGAADTEMVNFPPKFLKPSPAPQILSESTSNILGEKDVVSNFSFNVNVPAVFSQGAKFEKDLEIAGALKASKITASQITAPNVVYSLSAGSGISVSSGQIPTISNTGVLSLGGYTGALSLTAGSGISISGLTITNSDRGSSVNVFKTFSVSGQSDIVADSNTDTFTFVAGTGITLTTDANNDKLTITGTDTGWTDDGTVVRLTTSTDKVGIGTANPSTTLHVVGSSTLGGNVTLGGAITDAITFTGRIANNTAILPINDLGADLGSADLRFNNLYVANINTNQAMNFVGQATFTYPPASTSYIEASVLIIP